MEQLNRTTDARYYVYIYLDPRKPGNFEYQDLKFVYQPFYVGKGTGSRYREHTQEKKQTCNNHKSNTIKKIFKSGFDPLQYVFFIGTNLEEQEALKLETSVISKIGCCFLKTGPLTNKTEGGEAGNHYAMGLSLEEIHGEEKAKEIRKKLSNRFSGENNPMFGKVSAMKGKKLDIKHAKTLKDSNYKPVYQFDRDKNQIALYSSAVEAALKTGIKTSSITVAANPNCVNKTGGGYAWIYKEDFDKYGEEWLLNFESLYTKRNHEGYSKKVHQLDKNTLEIVDTFRSITEAARILFPQYRAAAGDISKSILKGKPCKGFRWKFVDEPQRCDKL